MSALPQHRPMPRQVFDDDPQVLSEVLREGVNLAVWTRRLSPALRDFAAVLVRSQPTLALSLTLEMREDRLPTWEALRGYGICLARQTSSTTSAGWWRPSPA